MSGTFSENFMAFVADKNKPKKSQLRGEITGRLNKTMWWKKLNFT